MRTLYNTALISLLTALFLFCTVNTEAGCLTGAFISDNPAQDDIVKFKNAYGKKPYLVMVFIDWGHLIDKKIIDDVYSQGCALLITWEPWDFISREGIDYNQLLQGKYDKYIADFANQLKAVKKEVFLRFAHEMNGNWYPWAGTKIGKDRYPAIYGYVKNIFNKTGAANVKWIFSVNWEDVPKGNNHFSIYYPGDEYVDYIGIDGYNWGNTQAWSKWMSFKDIFSNRYNEIISQFKKHIIITEFSSAGSGGNKAIWIKEAMNDIKKMENIKAFVLFNVDKETDWNFPVNTDSGKELKNQLADPYFDISK